LIHFPISLKFIPFEERYPPEWVYDTKSPKPYMKDDPVPITDTWKAMEGLVEKGLVRNIGVSNFKVVLLRELLYSCRIKPAVLQVELHPELTQKKLLRYCREQGIQVTSFSTFGASSYIELGMATESDPIFKNQLIIDIASQY
jgi:D-xylose reductase